MDVNPYPNRNKASHPFSSSAMHMPNCLVPVSMDLRIISLYRGSKTCNGQGIVGNAMVHTKMGTSCLRLQSKENMNTTAQIAQQKGRK